MAMAMVVVVAMAMAMIRWAVIHWSRGNARCVD
jgi:hypothetical protein